MRGAHRKLQVSWGPGEKRAEAWGEQVCLGCGKRASVIRSSLQEAGVRSGLGRREQWPCGCSWACAKDPEDQSLHSSCIWLVGIATPVLHEPLENNLPSDMQLSVGERDSPITAFKALLITTTSFRDTCSRSGDIWEKVYHIGIPQTNKQTNEMIIIKNLWVLVPSM